MKERRSKSFPFRCKNGYSGGINLENLKAVNKRKNKLGMRRKGFIIAFLAPTLIAFCVFYLYPIITVFVTSFCKWDYTNITSPEFFGWSNLWDNYDYIFNKYPFFWEALRNSTTWANFGCGGSDSYSNSDCSGTVQKSKRHQICTKCLYYSKYDFNCRNGHCIFTAV